MSNEAFGRELGFPEATAIGLGTLIGGGIFILPSIAAAQAGPASTVSFVLAGAISLLAAVSHGEIATDMQQTDGGGYEYVHRALGPTLGSVVGWGMWTGLIFATAFYAVGFAQYVQFFGGGLPAAPLAVALVVLLVGLNYYGAGEAGTLQDAIVLVLLVLIAGFVVGGVPALQRGMLRPLAPEGWTAVIATTGTVYVSFIGFAIIATAAAEIERPARNVPLSMITSVVVATVLYVGVMVVSTGVLPADELRESTIPVADVATQFGGRVGALAMVAGAILATVSSANASILAAGRVSFAMGTEGQLPSWLGRIHGEFGTPHRAVAATGVGIAVLSIAGVGLAVLAEVASFMFLISYGLVHVAVVVLRRRDETYDPAFRIPDPLFPAVPVVGVVATVGVMTQMKPIVIASGVAVSIAGALWHVLRETAIHR